MICLQERHRNANNNLFLWYAISCISVSHKVFTPKFSSKLGPCSWLRQYNWGWNIGQSSTICQDPHVCPVDACAPRKLSVFVTYVVFCIWIEILQWCLSQTARWMTTSLSENEWKAPKCCTTIVKTSFLCCKYHDATNSSVKHPLGFDRVECWKRTSDFPMAPLLLKLKSLPRKENSKWFVPWKVSYT